MKQHFQAAGKRLAGFDKGARVADVQNITAELLPTDFKIDVYQTIFSGMFSSFLFAGFRLYFFEVFHKYKPLFV